MPSCWLRIACALPAVTCFLLIPAWKCPARDRLCHPDSLSLSSACGFQLACQADPSSTFGVLSHPSSEAAASPKNLHPSRIPLIVCECVFLKRACTWSDRSAPAQACAQSDSDTQIWRPRPGYVQGDRPDWKLPRAETGLICLFHIPGAWHLAGAL